MGCVNSLCHGREVCDDHTAKGRQRVPHDAPKPGIPVARPRSGTAAVCDVHGKHRASYITQQLALNGLNNRLPFSRLNGRGDSVSFERSRAIAAPQTHARKFQPKAYCRFVRSAPGHTCIRMTRSTPCCVPLSTCLLGAHSGRGPITAFSDYSTFQVCASAKHGILNFRMSI
jgi:hypothetical protein